MPTGYTEAVKDGISFEQFVWRCARGMGALITMRDAATDAPIPERFEPSDYHSKKLEEAKAALAELQALTPEQVEAKYQEEYAAACERHRQRQQESADLLQKYEAMLARVKEWRSPTPEHDGFKGFMLDQLRQSISFDCDTSYDSPPLQIGAAVWLEETIEKAKRDIAYHAKEHRAEVERTEARNSWVKALRDSLSQ